MKSILSKPGSASLNAFTLLLPFVLLNVIAINQIEPLYSLFKIGTPGGVAANPVGYLALIVSLLLLPVGAVIAIRPMLHQAAGEVRCLYVLNGVLAAVMLMLFVFITGAFATEIYACDVLRIPNCD